MPHLDSKSSELEPRAEKSRAQLAVAVVLSPEAGDMEAHAIAAALASFRAVAVVPSDAEVAGGQVMTLGALVPSADLYTTVPPPCASRGT